MHCTTIRLYLELAQELCGEENQLLISFLKPYKAVSCDTISHWVRSFMKAAGIDASLYGIEGDLYK